MYTLCIVLVLIASVLMVLAVLVQNPKSGMASNFGASNQVMGVRQTTDFLEKATWTIAAMMVVFSICSAHSLSSEKASQQETEISYSDASSNSAAAPVFPVEE